MPHFRRLLTILLGAGFIIAGVAPLAGAGSAPAPSAAPPSSGRGGVIVVQVKGLIDPPNIEILMGAIREANKTRASVVVINLDSTGAVDVDLKPLLKMIRESRVAITTWIGPSGSEAKGSAAVIAAASAILGVGTGAHIGPASPMRRDTDTPNSLQTSALLAEEALRVGRNASESESISTKRINAKDATASGVSDRICGGRKNGDGCATLGDFVVRIDGLVAATAQGPVRIESSRIIGEGQDRRRQPNQDVRFRKLGLVGQMEHTLTNPSFAYVLLLVGLSLIMFEFFTISIGLAGGAGAICVIGACIGFSHLPVSGLAVGLLLISMFGFAVDVQAGKPAVWSGISTLALIVGSITLYDAESSLNVPWWLLIVMVGATLLFMITAMPIAVRSRFSTPTVGREGLIGEMGEAVVAIDPDGVVLVRGAPWRARTNRATPIAAGDVIRVSEVDGLVLEVEPEEGAARDYREMRKGSLGDAEGLNAEGLNAGGLNAEGLDPS